MTFAYADLASSAFGALIGRSGKLLVGAGISIMMQNSLYWSLYPETDGQSQTIEQLVQ